MAVADQSSGRSAKRPRGRPFPKGISGNPAGRPPGIRDRRTLRAELLELLDEPGGKGKTNRRLLLEAILAEGKGGNVQAFRELRDTVDGRPKSTEDIEAQDQARDEPRVTVDILEVLGELPESALRKLQAAAIEAEKRAALGLPEARRLP